MREQVATDYDLDTSRHWPRLLKLARYLWPAERLALRVRVVISLAFLLFAKLVSSWAPIVYRDLINELNVGSEKNLGEPGALLVGLLLAYGAAKFLTVAFGEVRDFVFVKVAQETKRRIALETFACLHNLSLSYHLDRQTGGLSRVIERGTSAIQFILSFMLFNIIPTFLELVFVTCLLTYYFSWMYAGVTVVTLGSYICFTLICTEWRLKFRKAMNKQDEMANTKAIDSLLNYETVKYFGNESYELNRYDRALRAYEDAAVKSQSSLSFLNCGQNFIITAGTLSLLYMGVCDVLSGEQNIGSFVMLATYMMQLFLPLNFLGFVYRQMKQSLIDLDRMLDIREQENTGDQSKSLIDVPSRSLPENIRGDLEIRDLFFSYQGNREILSGISVQVPAGKTLAIVGVTGSGKSTIARLLYRFYEPKSGEILLDGINISSFDSAELRGHIGVVPQDPVLFNDTIGYNIRYGRLDASDEEVLSAAKSADIYEFIQKLDKGLQTKVGERGLKLSGGEKQRIAIARTILKDPAILVFDEASSALDSQTERTIQKSFEKLSDKKTTVMIAHRLSTVRKADEIIVLKEGKVLERGRHSELLALHGAYHELWCRQEAEIAKA